MKIRYGNRNCQKYEKVHILSGLSCTIKLIIISEIWQIKWHLLRNIYPYITVINLIIKRIGILSVNLTTCLHYHVRRNIVKRIDNPQSMICRTKEINNLQFVIWAYDWLKVLYLRSIEINDKKRELYLSSMMTLLINFWRLFLSDWKGDFWYVKVAGLKFMPMYMFFSARTPLSHNGASLGRTALQTCMQYYVRAPISIEEVVESDEDQTSVAWLKLLTLV